MVYTWCLLSFCLSVSTWLISCYTLYVYHCFISLWMYLCAVVFIRKWLLVSVSWSTRTTFVAMYGHWASRPLNWPKANHHFLIFIPCEHCFIYQGTSLHLRVLCTHLLKKKRKVYRSQRKRKASVEQRKDEKREKVVIYLIIRKEIFSHHKTL